MQNFYLDIYITISHGAILFYEILFDIGSPKMIICVLKHVEVLNALL